MAAVNETEATVVERSELLAGERVVMRGITYRVAKVMEKSVLLKKVEVKKNGGPEPGEVG